jgi:hypothetical protein
VKSTGGSLGRSGEWLLKKRGTAKRRLCRKLPIAADAGRVDRGGSAEQQHVDDALEVGSARGRVRVARLDAERIDFTPLGAVQVEGRLPYNEVIGKARAQQMKVLWFLF